jgi:transmembrane sensor
LKDYLNFTATDLAKDEYFQSWIHLPDKESDAFWRAFRSNHPEKGIDLDEAREILTSISSSAYTLSPENVSALWTKIQDASGLHQPTGRRRRKRQVWYWAAAAILLVSLSIPLLTMQDENIEYLTGFGETRTIVLPDGSTVILNANSHLVLKNNIEDLPFREVRLDGEAYFSVVHTHDNKPFIVSTSGGVAVEVLGTSFNVYDRNKTKIVLNSGKIRLSLPGTKEEERIVMEPGDMVEYGENSFTKKTVDPTIYAAWTEKKIILDQTSLREMIEMAKNNYNVDISVESAAMLDQTVSGSMPVADAENFVNQVAKVFQLNVVKDNGKFRFTDQ